MTSINAPRTRRQAMTLCMIMAISQAKPGQENRAAKRAKKRFKAKHPKGSTSWKM